MGPPRSITSSSEKDRQLRRLINRHSIQTSLIHDRLRATQQTLDTHAAELAAERRTSEMLRRKLTVCEERARAAEGERDDMREAVEELVRRGR